MKWPKVKLISPEITDKFLILFLLFAKIKRDKNK